jgi:hypothetical protein
MVDFQTKNPNLGKFWRVLQWKIVVYFMVIWSILLLFGLFYCYLVYFMDIWYILGTFGIFYIWQPCSVGLHGFVEPMEVGGDADEVGGAALIEEDEREDHVNGLGLSDLGNAPPLFDLPCDEVRKGGGLNVNCPIL